LNKISREERRKLDSVEPFDEWEEFALFAGHYFVLSARNTPLDNWNSCSNDKAVIPAANSAAGSLLRLTRYLPALPPTGTLSEGTTHINRRFAATFKTAAGEIFVHGGLGQQQRLQSMQSAYGRETTHAVTNLPIPGRMCHTISHCGAGEQGAGRRYLMVGGRASPKSTQSDCLLSSTGEIDRNNVATIEPARFRHCAVSIRVSEGTSTTYGVLVFGGKTAEGEVLGDWKFWSTEFGWQKVNVSGIEPAARFGASMAAIDNCRGIVLGGMDDCGNILDDFIEWEFSFRGGSPEIHCRNRKQDIQGIPNEFGHARFGSKLLAWKGKLLLIGGIIGRRIMKMDHEIMLINIENSTISIERMKLECSSQEHPLLIGFSAETVSDDQILIVGGGAVCFSMGSFLNPPMLLLTETSTGQAESVTSVGTAVDSNAKEETQNLAKDLKYRELDPSAQTLLNGAPRVEVAQVPRVRIDTAEEFDAIVSAGKPIIIEGQPLGACTSLWTTSYLESRIGADHMVVVHSSTSPRLTFQQKNFTYTKQPFGAFIRGIENGEKLYLRSVSAAQPLKQPTNLSTDFPALAADFALPPPFAQALARAHSSPLRISGPVALWLHYDVLANVLCQIRGAKTLRLHPPSDVPYLAVPPGASSSDVEVFGADALEKHPLLARTRPHEARLREGDVLYIPPMWFHGARPEEGWSVAVNVFFRNLEEGCYALGRDVYGNRDLKGYEEGRRTVERIAKGFDGVPADIKAFYLERLSEELRRMG
jgi:tRNA wybutosine-synthesizing protein 4